jgi:hypothetical protein
MAEPNEPARAGYLTFIWLAWYSAVAAMRRNLLLVLGGLIVIGLAQYGSGLLGPLLTHLENSTLQGLLEAFAFLALGVVQCVAVAPIAIAVHRLVILNTGMDGVLHRRVARFATWLVAIWLFNQLRELPPLIFGQSGSIVLVFMVGLAVAVISLRTVFVFPALATDVPGTSVKQRVEDSWLQTKGHFWRLLLVTAGAFLPVAIVGRLLNGAVAQIATKAGTAIWPLLATDLLDGIVLTVAAALGAGIASWIYLWALDHPYQQPAEAEQSPGF